MSGSGVPPNDLDVAHVAASQNQKEVTINAGFDAIAAALTGTLALSVAAGDGAPTAAALRRAQFVSVADASAPGRKVVFPAGVKRLLAVALDAASAHPVALVRGSASVALPPGGMAVVHLDGSADGLRAVAGAGGGAGGGGAPAPGGAGDAFEVLRANAAGDGLEYSPLAWEGSVGVNGKPGAGECLVRHVFAGPVRFAAGLAGWRFNAFAPPSAEAVFTAYKNGSAFGTATVAAGTGAASFAAAAAVDFAPGDLLTVLAPAAQDAALADFGLTLYGARRG